MNFILIAVIVLGAIALISAIVLYAVSKKFAVQEDRSRHVEDHNLPSFLLHSPSQRAFRAIVPQRCHMAYLTSPATRGIASEALGAWESRYLSILRPCRHSRQRQ